MANNKCFLLFSFPHEIPPLHCCSELAPIIKRREWKNKRSLSIQSEKENEKDSEQGRVCEGERDNKQVRECE